MLPTEDVDKANVNDGLFRKRLMIDGQISFRLIREFFGLFNPNWWTSDDLTRWELIFRLLNSGR